MPVAWTSTLLELAGPPWPLCVIAVLVGIPTVLFVIYQFGLLIEAVLVQLQISPLTRAKRY